MQLSESTLTILKNFSTINTGLAFKKGNVLRTMNPGKSIIVEAVIEDQIPADFCIYELNQLLSIISLHKTPPELHVEGNDVLIKSTDHRSKSSYRCCKIENIKTPPENNITVPTPKISFHLSEEDLKWIMKSSSVLNSPNIAVFREHGKIKMKAYDSTDDSAHTDTLDICVDPGDDCFCIFKTENLKLLSGPYTVNIASEGIAKFDNTARKLTYWIALESKKA